MSAALRPAPVAAGGGAVLGISAHYHDASAALVVGGTVVAAAAEERFTRLKHDASFPERAVRFCLTQGGLAADDLDAIVFYEEPPVKFTRVMATTLADFPAGHGHFSAAMKRWLGGALWTRNEISAALDVHPDKVESVAHHESHAAFAYHGSPFEEAAVVTVDGVGEWACTSIGVGSARHGVSLLETSAYPNSLGLVYSAFTAFLGFRPNDGEASTMALAAFGRPRYADEVRRLVQLHPDGRYSVDASAFNFLSAGGENLFAPSFTRLFGAARDARAPLPFDCLAGPGGTPVSEADQRWADIAASVQIVIEEAVVGLAARAHRLTGSRNLCFGGGVALNAVANTRLVEHPLFEHVFIPPDPGDGGSAVGAALLAYHRRKQAARALPTPAGPGARTRTTPYLGAAAGDSAPFVRLVEALDPAAWSGYRLPGASAPPPGELATETAPDEEALVRSVAAELAAGRIVGWFQGRFELGPRALGNRSILVDPANLGEVRRLSATVKQRASYRPYALSIRDEDLEQVFAFEGRATPDCARWMQMVKRVRLSALPRVRGAVHVDLTTRLQACSARDNPRFHRLLSACGELTGLGALLNTSFNESGYPMVATAEEALLMFARSDMDTLVIDDVVVRKPRPC